MAVEVKREPALKDVERHSKWIALIRQCPPAEVKRKKLLGALAKGAVDDKVRDYAHQVGFFVLELTGESRKAGAGSRRLYPPKNGNRR